MECKLKDFVKPGDITKISDRKNIHRNTISRYMKNEQLPRIDHAYKIASYYGKTVYDIWPPE
ncbi:helix-turn-helix transcriptional regulator [Salinibacillus xinjiangensis]|uniref:Helix-turn-helix domain-containing protein n=1 Tax=Salinibacillus xinjiangensis TaxID=1229268 RepID=A0A6G1X7V8_9BACI|nr:helix-turn-helix domain-containing protein [Salinibacillus xinjiangensis]